MKLTYLPDRTAKPRQTGVSMVMDKSLSLREAEDLIASAHHLIDFVKLGFGTSIVCNQVAEKVKIYQQAGIKVYVGGTLFEAFLVRNMFDDYRKYIDNLGLDTVEISDGSMIMDHDEKCEYIHKLTKNYTVLSEVGSKESGILIAPNRWIEMMQKELQAGSFKVIAEARESGNVGIYRPTGKAHVSLINKILTKVTVDKILWEAPLKSQQVWFIKNFGSNVNLGNIPPSEIIPLETLRLGLRGDTFFQFLPPKFRKLQPK
ncbi:MAG: phosphosulfolactate synthase [Bacteroidales bacterium]|nr:phosphosulfolactate synthase [Bacteroidales bacterium]MDD4603822.1 phosphosulfolactate synthase [Bacteroidales bacterium]